MIRCYLGIDGGGTKTAFVLKDINGKTAELQLGPSNPNDVGMDGFKHVIMSGIEALCKDVDLAEVSVFCGAAGALSGDNLQKIEGFFAELGFGCFGCGGDAQNVLEFALGESDGIAVILGTGCVALARKQNNISKIGGWGYLLGDEGSGYKLGRDALAEVYRAADGRSEKTVLYDLVSRKLGMDPVSALSGIYERGKHYIAEFAPCVFDAYMQGDAYACRILDDNYKAAAEMLRRGAEIVGGKAVKAVFCGGLTAQKRIIDPIIKKYLGDTDIEIEYKPGDMVQGALRLAERQSK